MWRKEWQKQMARRFATRRRGPRQKRDLIWVTVLVDTQANDVTATVFPFLSSAEWTAVPGVGFERATLLRVVGNLTFSQQVSGTLTDGSQMAFAIEKVEASSQAVDPTDPVVNNIVDFLHVGSVMIGSSTSVQDQVTHVWPIDITVKRKMTTDTLMCLVSRITADTAAPLVNIGGMLRCLVDRT